jgi:hypothetical protein
MLGDGNVRERGLQYTFACAYVLWWYLMFSDDSVPVVKNVQTALASKKRGHCSNAHVYYYYLSAHRWHCAVVLT